MMKEPAEMWMGQNLGGEGKERPAVAAVLSFYPDPGDERSRRMHTPGNDAHSCSMLDERHHI